MWTRNSCLPRYETSSLERRVVTSTAKFICRRNIVAKCHHVFGSRKDPVWPDIVQRKSNKSIRQDPCGMASKFANSLVSWWDYFITNWGRNCAIRVGRVFEDTSSHKSEIWAPTNTTERPKGIFSENHAKKLIDLFQDMIERAPISKPAILKRLANKELDKKLFKDYTVAQIVSRLKYGRKRKQSNKRLVDN